MSKGSRISCGDRSGPMRANTSLGRGAPLRGGWEGESVTAVVLAGKFCPTRTPGSWQYKPPRRMLQKVNKSLQKCSAGARSDFQVVDQAGRAELGCCQDDQ